MMMISQCVNFQPYSIGYWKSWNALKPDGSITSTSKCDWLEVQDLISFQQFTRAIPVKEGWPDVVATHIPLSVIFAAHHNLVAYGVAFWDKVGVWVNPPKKRYYVPQDVIKVIAAGRLFERDEVVQTWVAHPPEDLVLDLPDVPGMSRWVERANREWTHRAQMSDLWHGAHEFGQSPIATELNVTA